MPNHIDNFFYGDPAQGGHGGNRGLLSEKALNHIVRTAPQYTPVKKKQNFFPMSTLFAYMMMTTAGYAAFRYPAINDAVNRILAEWCRFLDSPGSTYVLDTGKYGWLSPPAFKQYELQEFVIPDRGAPHWGWTSFNAFFHRQIKQYLFGPIPVAWALMVGGLVMLLIERLKPVSKVSDATGISPRQALGVGLAQVLSLFPGVSRSGATIMGGYALGLSRTAATEFSFFLSVPVMIAATSFDLLKSREALSLADFPIFAIGFIVSFVSAVVVVRAFLRYIGHHSFTAFAWYRIVLGGLLLWWYLHPSAPGV